MARVDTGETIRGGTALIVVPGVGDDSAGDTVGSMTTALLVALGPGAHSTPAELGMVVPPAPGSRADPVVHEVRCARIHRPGDPAPLLVYEMHWADLSRFPDRLGRFVLTLYGMLFQISTIGLEALRSDTAGNRSQRFTLNAFSYLTAVLALGLTAGAAILGVEFAALVRFTGHAATLAIATLALLIAGGMAWYGDRFLRARGWRFDHVPHHLGRPGLAFGVVAAGVGVVPLLIHAGGDPMAVAVSDVLWIGVRGILPAAWALVGVAALACCVLMVRETIAGPEARRRYAAARTALLSVVIGGLGIALLGALLVAVALAATSRATGADRLVPEQAADRVGAGGPAFSDYSLAVFQESLRPLGVALICALVLIAAILVTGFGYISALAQSRQPAAAPARSVWALVACVLAVAWIPALVYADEGWADVLAVALAVIAAAAAVIFWGRLFRPDAVRGPLRRGFDRLLAYFGSPVHAVLLTGALGVAAAALVLATPATPGVARRLGDLSQSFFEPFAELASGSSATTLKASATAAGILAIATFLASRLPLLAKGLDVAYDVATYMRIPHGAPTDPSPVEPPRRQILRRYAALLEHIRIEQAPERIVIAAHSQGSMYSLALLFGDRYRDSADRLEGASWPLAPRLVPDHPEAIREAAPGVEAPIALLTAGCPILQTYAPNFPGQYDWPSDRDAVIADLARVGTRGATWRNVYRSGDYLGRALWTRDVCGDDPPLGPLSEHCLGPGQHTGYWADPRFARQVLALL